MADYGACVVSPGRMRTVMPIPGSFGRQDAKGPAADTNRKKAAVMNDQKPKKRSIAQEVDFIIKRDAALKQKKKCDLSPAFLRPPYQYTSIENKTIERIHEDDWLK